MGLPLKRLEIDSLESRREHVRATALFAEVKDRPEVVDSLARQLKWIHYPVGAAIIQEGEPGTEMYFLARGRAVVTKRTTDGEPYRVAILSGEQHAFFGEGALLDCDSRSATIVAETECECFVLTREGFEQFGKEHPEWAFPVLSTISRTVLNRLRKANSDLMLLYRALIAEIRGS
jgi:CRP/FNR family cyclic AMP-dependent transcriptional regulator